MRTPQTIYDLILSTAQADPRVRAVLLNGSRANPNAPPDPFQDFDIVYVVTELDSFLADPAWIDCFGPRLILQLPDDMEDPPPARHAQYTYLIQFTDGNRLDLTLFPLARLPDLPPDSLTVLLLDKDGLFPSLPPSSDRDYLPQPPTPKAFADCCNEFWWVSLYVAKGLWRQEILYARYMLDQIMRPQLDKMLVWYAGYLTGFAVSPGKFGKYLRRYLPSDLWEQLLQTYAPASYPATWAALFTMCDLFRRLALPLADGFSLPYPHADAAAVTARLHHIHNLSSAPSPADSL